MNKRMNTFLRMAKKQDLLRKRKSNRTMMITSLIGIGAAAAYGLKRNRNNIDLSKTVQSAMNSIQNADIGKNMTSMMADFTNRK